MKIKLFNYEALEGVYISDVLKTAENEINSFCSNHKIINIECKTISCENDGVCFVFNVVYEEENNHV